MDGLWFCREQRTSAPKPPCCCPAADSTQTIGEKENQVFGNEKEEEIWNVSHNVKTRPNHMSYYEWLITICDNITIFSFLRKLMKLWWRRVHDAFQFKKLTSWGQDTLFNPCTIMKHKHSRRLSVFFYCVAWRKVDKLHHRDMIWVKHIIVWRVKHTGKNQNLINL